MIKKIFNLRNVLAIAICLAGITMFSGCDKDKKTGTEQNGNNNNNNSTFTSGWPSAGILANFGLTGLTAPVGVTNIEYSTKEITGDDNGLGINFKGYATSDNPFSTVLAANGWILDDNSTWVEDAASYWVYRKGNDYLVYGWSYITGSSIIVIKNYYEE